MPGSPIVVEKNRGDYGRISTGFVPEAIVSAGAYRREKILASGGVRAYAWIESTVLGDVKADHLIGSQELMQQLQQALLTKLYGNKANSPGLPWPSIVEIYPFESYMIYSMPNGMKYRQSYALDPVEKIVRLSAITTPVNEKFVDACGINPVLTIGNKSSMSIAQTGGNANYLYPTSHTQGNNQSSTTGAKNSDLVGMIVRRWDDVNAAVSAYLSQIKDGLHNPIRPTFYPVSGVAYAFNGNMVSVGSGLLIGGVDPLSFASWSADQQDRMKKEGKEITAKEFRAGGPGSGRHPGLNSVLVNHGFKFVGNKKTYSGVTSHYQHPDGSRAQADSNGISWKEEFAPHELYDLIDKDPKVGAYWTKDDSKGLNPTPIQAGGPGSGRHKELIDRPGWVMPNGKFEPLQAKERHEAAALRLGLAKTKLTARDDAKAKGAVRVEYTLGHKKDWSGKRTRLTGNLAKAEKLAKASGWTREGSHSGTYGGYAYFRHPDLPTSLHVNRDGSWETQTARLGGGRYTKYDRESGKTLSSLADWMSKHTEPSDKDALTAIGGKFAQKVLVPDQFTARALSDMKFVSKYLDVMNLLQYSRPKELAYVSRQARGTLGTFNAHGSNAGGRIAVNANGEAHGYGWTVGDHLPTAAERQGTTLLHEIGHHVHYILGGSGNQQWMSDEVKSRKTAIEQAYSPIRNAKMKGLELVQPNGTMQVPRETPSTVSLISEYSAKNVNEYFAETFVAYHIEPDKLKNIDPAGYAVMDGIVKKYGGDKIKW
jgi:hypothetical protein